MIRSSYGLALLLVGCSGAADGETDAIASGLLGARSIAATPDYVFVRTSDGLVRFDKDGGNRTVVHGATNLRLTVRSDALYFTDAEGTWICVGGDDPVLLSAEHYSDYSRFDVEEGLGAIWFPWTGRIHVLSLDGVDRNSITVADRIAYVHDVAIVGDRMLYAGDDDTTYLTSLTDGQIATHGIDAEDVQRNDTDFYVLDRSRLYRLGPDETEPREVTAVDAFSVLGVGPLGAVVHLEDDAGERGLVLFRSEGDVSVPIALPGELVAVTDGVAVDDEAVYVVAREPSGGEESSLFRIEP